MKTQKTAKKGIILLFVWSIIFLALPTRDGMSQHNTWDMKNDLPQIKPLSEIMGYSSLKEGGLPVLPTVQLNVQGSDALIHDITIGRGGGGLMENTAIGLLALYFNTHGSKSDNDFGKYNTAIGAGAMHKNEMGNFNTSVGAISLYSNTSGSFNTASGYGALYSNTSGYYNTASGYEALYSNTSGACNIAKGFQALYNNTSGGFNTAIGVKALFHNNTGIGNTAVGFNALEANITGSRNTAFGYRTLELNPTGENNTAVGFEAGKQSDSGASINEGTFVGADAYSLSNDLINVTGIGYGARPTQSNQVWLGNSAVESFFCAPLTIPSDERYKFNVEEKVAGLDFILSLRPVIYNLDVHEMATLLGEDIRYDKDGNKYLSAPSERMLEARNKKSVIVYSGFVAQEVEAAANKLGYDFSGVRAPENENGFYGLQYATFTVPIVKAIQEQQQQIELLEPAAVEVLQIELQEVKEKNQQLEEKNRELESKVDQIFALLLEQGIEPGDHNAAAPSRVGSDRTNRTAKDQNAHLEQNTPNPFQENTVIRYFLPQDTARAQLIVTDLQGNRIQTNSITGSGPGELTIDGGALSPGTYVYSLVINGQVADSKRMVLL